MACLSDSVWQVQLASLHCLDVFTAALHTTLRQYSAMVSGSTAVSGCVHCSTAHHATTILSNGEWQHCSVWVCSVQHCTPRYDNTQQWCVAALQCLGVFTPALHTTLRQYSAMISLAHINLKIPLQPLSIFQDYAFFT